MQELDITESITLNHSKINYIITCHSTVELSTYMCVFLLLFLKLTVLQYNTAPSTKRISQ